MIEDHIADGDLVVVRKQPTCQNGEIVVARTRDGEVTLKRFYRSKNRIRLQPANQTLKPIYGKSVEIIGISEGCHRRLYDWGHPTSAASEKIDKFFSRQVGLTKYAS